MVTKQDCWVNSFDDRFGLRSSPPKREFSGVASVPAEPGWAMRRELMSQTFTTKVSELWTIKAKYPAGKLQRHCPKSTSSMPNPCGQKRFARL
nr:DUF4113 domain-containing protein [Pseudomonas fluorescens]